MKKIEHIGVAVEDIAKAKKIFSTIFGKDSYKTEEVISESVKATFFKIGESKIELLSATNTDSPIAKFLTKNREGMHHIAFQVDNLKAALDYLRHQSVQLIDEIPRIGAEGFKIAFIHPKSTGGVLIELCEIN